MRKILIILSLIILFVAINGISERSSSVFIKTDVKELYLLIKKLWSVSSDELKRANKRMCQILIECCSPKTYSKVLSRTIWAANHTYDPFIEARAVCIDSPIHGDVVKTCPPALSVNSSFSLPSQAALDMDVYKKYQTAVDESIKLIPVLSDFYTRMAVECNSKEIHAYLCALNYKLLTSCMNKILKNYFNSHSKKIYHMYVKNLTTIMTYMHQIMDEFK
jgi:hypothetical protein